MHISEFIDLTNILSIVTIFTGIEMLILGLLVYYRDVTRSSNTYFLLLAGVMSAWSVAAGLFEAIRTPAPALVVVILAVGALIPIALLLFSLAATTERVGLPKRKIFLLVASYIGIAVVICIPQFVVKDISANVSFGKVVMFGPGIYLFMLYCAIYVGVSLNIIFQGILQSAGVFRKQLRGILVAVLGGTIVIVGTSIVFPIVSVWGYFWVGPFASLFSMTYIAYLLTKYNFGNIKLFAAELFVSVMLLLLLGELFFVRSYIDFGIKILLVGLVGWASLFLLRNICDEIEAKDEVEKLLLDLEDANKRLKVLDKRKSEFMTMSAHHLRDPLTAITGYASMMLDGTFGTLTLGVHEALQKIYESSKRLVVIIQDFMDISQIESGTMHFESSTFSFADLTREVVEELQLSAKDSNLSLTSNVPDTGDFTVCGDRGKLRQVISNLIDNAIKYTPRGSIAIALKADNPARGKLVLSITDTGIGMEKETIEKIFKKFTRAEGASKVNTDGSGLGLYVAKEVMKKHNGRIWAASEGPGKGSTFFVELDRCH